MMRALEIATFLTLSGALHVAALTLTPVLDGGSGGGDRGEGDVTLRAATASLAAMVDTWDRPPTTSDAPALAVPEKSSAPNLSAPEHPALAHVAMPVLHQPASDHSPPKVESRLPAPAVPLAQTELAAVQAPGQWLPIAVPNTALDTGTAVSTIAGPPALPKAPSVNSGPALPSVDTRLPAPPSPLAQTDIATIEVPLQPIPVALPLTAPDARPQTPRPLPHLQDTHRPALPEVDNTPPAGQFAPLASLRPAIRPELRTPAPIAETRSQATATQPEARARGAGQQPVATPAPARTAPVASGPSQADIVQAQRQWGAKVRAAVERAKRYPSGTRASGTTRLNVRLNPAGQVVAVSVLQSSGDARLDRAAQRAVQRARLPRAPSDLTEASYAFGLSLRFTR